MIENDKMNVKQYKDVAQPFNLPDNLNLFSWSLPFIADKVSKMVENLMTQSNIVSKNELMLARQETSVSYDKVMNKLKDAKEKEVQDAEQHKTHVIKAKVLTMARFNLMLKNAKEHEALLTKVKKSNDGKLPKDMLFKSASEIQSYLDFFIHVRKMDSENEKFPIAKYEQKFGSG